MDLHYRTRQAHLNDGSRVVRVKPRYNPDVNQWWLCDEGRYGLGWIDRARLDKVRGPSADPANAASAASATWEQALTAISTALIRLRKEQGARIGVIASAQHTNEELFLIREIFRGALGARVSASVPEKPGSSDDFLIQADKNPNTLGATLLDLAGPNAPSAGQIVDEAIAGNLDFLWIMGHDLVDLFGKEGPPALRKGGPLRRLGHERERDRAFRTLGPARRSLCGEGRNLRELSRPRPTHRPRLSAAQGVTRGLAHSPGTGWDAGPASRLAGTRGDFPRSCPGVGALRD